jgi:lipopolysaccharide transport system ATP-binding protein
MTKREINRKFDDIVAFAEVEKFIDTPMKFYSSGMQVRLAFSIAAHLEPEILLVDEVLAVGDVAFQRKCISKMENVGKEGRTVLFVSHHMPSIVRLCERVILLNEGKIECDGPAQEVVSEYLQAGLDATSSRVWHDISKAPGSDIVRLRSIRIKTEANRSPIEISEDIGIEMEYDVLESGYVLFPHFIVRNEQGIKLFVSFDTNSTWFQNSRPKGTYVSTGWIPGNLLAEGTMIIGPAMTTYDPYEVHFYKPEAVAFHVVENPDDGNLRIDAPGIMPGVMRPLLKWETKFYPEGRKS